MFFIFLPWRFTRNRPLDPGYHAPVANDDLRAIADRLEAELMAGRPDRHRARQLWFGRLVTSGRWPLTVQEVATLRKELAEQKRDADAELLSADQLAAHRYTVEELGVEVEGKPVPYLIGPGSWCRTASLLESVIRIEQASSPSQGGSSGGSSGAVSRAEARRQISVSRDYAAWSEAIQERPIWDRAQARRAWLFGERFLDGTLNFPDPKLRAHLKELAAADPDPAVRELWRDVELAADYPETKAATPAV